MAGCAHGRILRLCEDSRGKLGLSTACAVSCLRRLLHHSTTSGVCHELRRAGRRWTSFLLFALLVGFVLMDVFGLGCLVVYAGNSLQARPGLDMPTVDRAFVRISCRRVVELSLWSSSLFLDLCISSRHRSFSLCPLCLKKDCQGLLRRAVCLVGRAQNAIRARQTSARDESQLQSDQGTLFSLGFATYAVTTTRQSRAAPSKACSLEAKPTLKKLQTRTQA